jgi:DNA-directed RNA polymerase specialized sigma24 family protein
MIIVLMATESTSGKARSLSPEAFASLLSWLSSDNNEAAQMYLDIRRKLVKLFVRKGCTHPEDLADRTLDRVAVIVHDDPAKYPNVMALCCGVARRVWLEYCREHATAELETEHLAAPVKPDNRFSDTEEKCLESCLEDLSPRDRAFITQYHRFQGAQKIEVRKRLADEYGGPNKVRILAYRIRIKLYDCVNGCTQRLVQN